MSQPKKFRKRSAHKKVSLYEKFLNIFGDILIYRWPLFVIYNPVGYRVRGDDIRDLIGKVQPGDILLRGYDNYLDGKFIPGYFSHVGLYLGEVTEADRPLASVHLKNDDEKAEGRTRFKTGPQMMIHSIAEGALMEDVINFCRCDYMAVVRFPAHCKATAADVEGAPGHVLQVAREELDPEEETIRAALLSPEGVDFTRAFAVIRARALGKLGAAYDFDFDGKRVDRLYCSELVAYATRCLSPFHQVGYSERIFLKFLKRMVIEPDAFARSRLDIPWKSHSVHGDLDGIEDRELKQRLG